VATLAIPGFVDAHCHAFQHALRGRARGGDFWAWREEMLALADSLELGQIRRDYASVYGELRANGYTAVGEFHYLGLDEARAAAAAATEAGIEFVCLYACYLRGGIPRFRQESAAAYLSQLEILRAEGISVGVAPHSVRACPPDALAEVGRYAAEQGLPLHVHACEQPREIEECLASEGVRPVELLDRTGCLGPGTTVVHATHADGRELDLLAAAGARICVCPTTEASLGDGFVPVARIVHRGIALCIGSDSNVRLDPLEELRELEGIGRRQTGRRGVLSVSELFAIGGQEGAAALFLETWPDAVVDLDHPQLRGVEPDARQDVLVFGCSSDVLRKTPAQ
jgi:formimidoylglutamate deiminase